MNLNLVEIVKSFLICYKLVIIFVVPIIKGNVEGVDFYILQCQHRKFMINEPFTCVWGCEFDTTNYVVAGTYCQKWGRSSESYVFLEHSNVMYIDAHLVKVIKFPMTLGDHRLKGDDPIYKLLVEHESMIYVALNEDD